MNKTEGAYYKHYVLPGLESGEIALCRYEEITLKLAERTTYTPDFLLVYQDGSNEFVEVKGGFVRDDARVKLKVAAEKFKEFRFRMVTMKAGRIDKEEKFLEEV